MNITNENPGSKTKMLLISKQDGWTGQVQVSGWDKQIQILTFYLVTVASSRWLNIFHCLFYKFVVLNKRSFPFQFPNSRKPCKANLCLFRLFSIKTKHEAQEWKLRRRCPWWALPARENNARAGTLGLQPVLVKTKHTGLRFWFLNIQFL